MAIQDKLKLPNGVTIRGKDNIANYLMTTETNQSNLDIAQMNNEYNARMQQAQNDYNYRMWQENNEYNTPANQAARLKAAGLNPALIMGSGNTGISSSPAAGVSPIPAESVSLQAPHVENSYGDIMSFLGYATDAALQGLNNFEDLKQKQLDNSMKQIDSILYEKKAILELNRLGEELYGKRGENLGKAIENALNLETFDDSVRRIHYDTKRSKYEAGLAFYQEGIAELTHFNLPREQSMQLANLAADYALKVAQKDLTLKQAKHELSKQVNTILNSYGFEYVSKKDKDRILNALIENLENSTSNYENNIITSLTNNGGDIIGSLLKGAARRIPGIGKFIR